MDFLHDDLETFDRLLGAKLALLLDELDAMGHEIDTPGVSDGRPANGRAAPPAERHERLRAEALDGLLAVRRRLASGVLPERDERTMSLPFVS